MIAAVFMLCWLDQGIRICDTYEASPFNNRIECQIWLNTKLLEVQADGVRVSLGSCIERKT